MVNGTWYMALNLEPKMKNEVEYERMDFWQRIHWNERFASVLISV